MSDLPLIEDPEFGKDLLNQVMELWVGPEIDRRKAEGRLPDDFVLWAAQVLMDVGGSGPVVRLNDEVRAVAQVKTNRPVGRGELVRSTDVDKIVSIGLTDEDPDSAHVTLWLIGGSWRIAFDFRYNATRVAEHIERAEEFFAAAQANLEAGRLNACADSMFSAAELAAKAMLLAVPDEKYLRSKNHGTVRSDFNRFSRDGWWRKEHAALLNRLGELRVPSRYPGKASPMTAEEASELLARLETLIDRARLAASPRTQMPSNLPRPEAAGGNPGPGAPSSGEVDS